ncbi:MAG TPA: hypothetical protein VF120_12860, partial [Ktedonobacterales bacterium]
IALYDMPARTLLERGITGLLPLVPFCRDGGTLGAIERAAEMVKAQATATEQQELESLLAVFGARFVGNGPMLAMIRRLFMSTEILETSPLYQEWVGKAREEGKAEGKAEGEARGKAEGKAEGLREAALAVLRSRFGELAPPLVDTINSAVLAQLQDVLAHATTDSLEQITARLGQPPA